MTDKIINRLALVRKLQETRILNHILRIDPIAGEPPRQRVGIVEMRQHHIRKTRITIRTADLVSVAGLMPVSGHGLLPVNAGSASLVGAQWTVAGRRRYSRINLRISVDP